MSPGRSDEAVSAVLGVLLLVAITVVLAIVVFLITSGLGEDSSEAAPGMAIRRDEQNDKLEVTKNEAGADWSRVQVLTDSSGIRFALNARSTSVVGTGISAGTPLLVLPAGYDPVSPAETISFCDSGALVEEVTVTLVDQPANKKIGEFVFLDIARCT